MIKSTRVNGHPTDEAAPAEHEATLHVAEDIDAAARRVPTEDASGAALRSILIGAALIGGLTFVARLLFQRQSKARTSSRR